MLRQRSVQPLEAFLVLPVELGHAGAVSIDLPAECRDDAHLPLSAEVLELIYLPLVPCHAIVEESTTRIEHAHEPFHLFLNEGRVLRLELLEARKGFPAGCVPADLLKAAN